MLAQLLEEKRTLIVVGPGGVGKTTTAAAFAVQAARMGKKTLVLTVDPARRLANSLGLEELGNTEVRIAPELFAEAGIPLENGGALYGMMLDTKSTFDDLIERYAPNAETRRKIFDNAFYQQASTALAGSQEYMAMEKLYEIREQRDYDLIVLDTPPTSNALDFLSAPDRLEDFLGSPATRALVKGMKAAGRVGLGFLKFNTFVMRGLNRFVGADTFLGILEFVQSFSEMYAGFKARARRVREILRADDVGFVIVTSTNRTTIDEGTFFYEQLASHGMPFGAVVVNRVRTPFLAPDELEGLERRLIEAARDSEALASADGYHVQQFLKRGAEHCRDYEIMAQVDADRLALVKERFAGNEDRIYPVPQLERDVHDVGSLAEFAERVTSVQGGRLSRAGVFALALAAALAAGCRTEPVRDAEATTRPAPPETRAPVAPTARPPETTPPEPPPEPATPAPDAAPEGAPTGDAIRAALVGFAKVLDGGSVAPNGDLWGALADPAAGVTMAAVTLPKDDGAASLDVDWKGGDAVRRVVDEGESALFRPLYGPARALVRDLALGLPSATCRDAHCVRVLADGGQHVFRFGVAPGGELRLLGVLRAEDPRLAAEPDTLAQIRAVFDAAVDGHRPESWPR